MSPSRYQLPQFCSLDRSRARRLTLNAQRRLFDLKFEDAAFTDEQRKVIARLGITL